MASMSLCSRLSGTLCASLCSLMSACRVSQLGTHPMSPELGDSGTTAYLAMERSPALVAGVASRSMFTSPNSCMTRSSCLRSSWPLSRYP